MEEVWFQSTSNPYPHTLPWMRTVVVLNSREEFKVGIGVLKEGLCLGLGLVACNFAQFIVITIGTCNKNTNKVLQKYVWCIVESVKQNCCDSTGCD